MFCRRRQCIFLHIKRRDRFPYITEDSSTYRFAWTSFYWGGAGLFSIYHRQFQYIHLHGRRFIRVALDCSPYIKGSSKTYKSAWTSFYWGGSRLFSIYQRQFQYIQICMDFVLLGWLWIVLHISGTVPVHTDLHGRRFISVALDCSLYIRGSSNTYRLAWTSFY